jgi:hypothetical protein
MRQDKSSAAGGTVGIGGEDGEAHGWCREIGLGPRTAKSKRRLLVMRRGGIGGRRFPEAVVSQRQAAIIFE